jgi:chromosomal replication initiator protein
MHNQVGDAVMPSTLERAFDRQRIVYPDDDDALKRLFAYLETTRPTLAEIKEVVCEFYGYELVEISARDRQQHAALARAIFCFLAHRHTRWPMGQIGRRVGLTNHTTVLHAIRRIEKAAASVPIVRDDLDLLRLRIAEKILRRRKAWAQC